MQQGAQHEAKAVLEEAKRRFPTDMTLAETLASVASFSEEPTTSLKNYRDLFDKASTLHDQLRFARAMGWWAARMKRSPELLAEFGNLQRQPPDNALQWLVLAALHGGVGDQLKQDDCVRKASQAGSTHAEVLYEIAALQQEATWFDKMRASLKTAAAIDKGQRGRQQLAWLELMHGEVAEALRMYDALAPQDNWEPETLLQMAHALMRVAEWPRVLALLSPQVARHPEDCRLHSMLAIAQEEEGLVDQAAASWLTVLGMTHERPSAPLALWLHPWSSAPLPKGTEVWLYLSGVLSDAYDYRHWITARAEGHRDIRAEDNLLPWGLESAPLFAFAHLRSVAFELSPQARQSLLKEMQRLGYEEAADLLNIPVESNQLRIDGAFLDQHPNNKALHAAWYLDKDQFRGRGGMMISRFVVTMPGSEPTPERLEHCFKLFAKNYPELALNAALKSLAAESTMKALPAVIARLGAVSPQTLDDLETISAHAAKVNDELIIRDIEARLERWLQGDRVPSAAREQINRLVTEYTPHNPRLAGLLATIKQREGWTAAQATAPMYFNNRLLTPGDGQGQPTTSRRPEAKQVNPHKAHVDRRQAADAAADQAKQQLQAKHRDLAMRELRQYMQLAAEDWLNYSPNDASYIRLDSLRYKVAKLDATLSSDTLKLFANDADPALYGALLEMNNQLDEAGVAYQRAYQGGNRQTHLLRRLAVHTARTDVQAGLQLFHSIPKIELSNCIECLANDSGPGNGGYIPPAIRLANARLLIAWLEERATNHKPLPSTLRLESATSALGRGSDKTQPFGGLWRDQNDSAVPYPADFHEAFDALCRAFMKFPTTAITGFATMAAVAKSEGKPLEPLYQQALQLLRDRRITDLDMPDTILWSEDSPRDGRLPLLHPAVFATEYAALSKSPGTFEKEVLPVVLLAYGSGGEAILRAYAAMCVAGDDSFIRCAEQWLAIKGQENWRRDLFPENRDGKRTAIVERLWQEKKLTVPLAELLRAP